MIPRQQSKVEKLQQWAIFRSHMVQVHTNPLQTMKRQPQKLEKWENCQNPFKTQNCVAPAQR